MMPKQGDKIQKKTSENKAEVMIGRHTNLLSNRGRIPAKYPRRANFHIRLFIFDKDTSCTCHEVRRSC